MNPAAFARLWWAAAQTAMAAQATVALRLWALSSPALHDGAWARAELVRMVSEKQRALLESGSAMQRALCRSSTLLPLLEAGLRPYRRRTTRNARRLARRA